MTIAGKAGEVIDIPRPEAVKFESCGFLKILPDNEQPERAMAYETAKAARMKINRAKK